MTSRECVKRAVHFGAPDRIPVFYFNEHPRRSDIIAAEYAPAASFRPAAPGQSEWGFVWETADGTMGQPTCPPVESREALAGYLPPDPALPERYAHIPALQAAWPDRYILGRVGERTISGFNIASYIRGFEGYLEDLVLEPEFAAAVFDVVVEFELEVIRQYGALGLDCVAFGDDWGSQAAMMVSPATFRRLFLPRYRAQFALAHSLGMDVYFHCCGQVMDILPDLVEAGVDILNLNQPEIFGVATLAEALGGKVCLNCPVDHQTVAVRGTDEAIRRYARVLCEKLSSPAGGFIAYIEKYDSIGMTDCRYRAIVEGFERAAGLWGR